RSSSASMSMSAFRLSISIVVVLSLFMGKSLLWTDPSVPAMMHSRSRGRQQETSVQSARGRGVRCKARGKSVDVEPAGAVAWWFTWEKRMPIERTDDVGEPLLAEIARRNQEAHDARAAPLSRIGGRLEIHCAVDLGSRRVADVASMASLFRG